MGIEVRSSAPSATTTKDGSLPTGQMYVDSTTGRLYIYNGGWRYAQGGTSTSTSTTSSSSSSTSSTSSSTSTTSTTSSSSSTSTTSTSTSTTL